MVRTALSSLLASVCLLSLMACDADKPTRPTASGSPTGTTTQTLPTSPATSPVPPYLSEYSDRERRAYRDAVDDYEAFADRNAALVRKGRATPAARRFYQQATASWQSY